MKRKIERNIPLDEKTPCDNCICGTIISGQGIISHRYLCPTKNKNQEQVVMDDCDYFQYELPF
jgi:hypothetical protein